MSGAGQRSVEILVEGVCARVCALCDCREPSTEHARATQSLAGGGGRLELRGPTTESPHTVGYLHRAKGEGFKDVVVRTSAAEALEPGVAAKLLADGADAVLVPLFSHVAAVHDRVVGQPRALARTLAGMRAFAAAGLAVEIEVPLLPARLQSLPQLLDLAHRAVPTLRAAWFNVPRLKVPVTLAPPRWDEGAPLLAQGIAHAKALGIRVALRRRDGVPLCALRSFPDAQPAYQFAKNVSRPPPRGSRHAPPCEGCAVKDQCPGVSDSYFDAHRDAGVTPFARRPADLYDQRTTPRRKWTDEQRVAARNSKSLVLRPTVNCNQDCTFCSANETSNNVWSDRGAMLREIARAGRRGVVRVSFSGGEPTLSKDLVDYVRAARRVGIREIEAVTNGTLLDVEKRVLALKEAGLTDAFVSLHAHDDALSRTLTQKTGDFDKTVAAIDLLVKHDIRVVVNHVITRRNYRQLERYVSFVAGRWAGRVNISFAFVTPQYKVLDDLTLMPRLSDVMPHLKRALYRAQDLKQNFVIGSRQGIPVCFLGEFRGWSDFGALINEASAEDAPQKQRTPACDRCRFGERCTGIWKPYVARYGLDEVVPVDGARLTSEELRWIPPAKHISFAEVPDAWRDREGERTGRERAEREVAEEASRDRSGTSLPVFTPRLARPARIALLGTGHQARRLARAVRQVPELSLDAVASPHAPENDLSDFAQAMVYRDAVEAMDDIRPDAVIVAAATHAHHELALAALDRRIPVLLEKPLTRTDEEAEALVRKAVEQGTLLMPAHNMLFTAGFERVLGLPGLSRLAFVKRTPQTSPDAPRSWGRSALYETLYHALVVAHRACGGGVPTVTATQWQGSSRPERLRIALDFARARAELILDFASAGEDLSLTGETAQGESVAWHRAGSRTTLTRGGRTEEVERDGNDVERMLRAFVDAVRGRSAPATHPSEALEVMRGCRVVLDALAEAGAPLERATAPRHVASRDLQQTLRS